MTDKTYIKNTLDHLKAEKLAHGTKFAGNPVHENCGLKFDRAIETLEKELDKLNASSPQTSTSSKLTTEPPLQVGEGMLWNDVEDEIFQVAEEKMETDGGGKSA